MGAFIALAAEIIPQLISAGMTIIPVLEKLVGTKDTPTDADWDFLHQQRAAALAIINDTSRDA